ncbi:MAG: GTPase HflX [Pseudomonadota bacterium]
MTNEDRFSRITDAIVVLPLVAGDQDLRRAPEARLDEAAGLAEAIDLQVVDKVIAPITQPKPSTLFGTGKVSEIADRLVEAGGVQLAIVDASLSPVQHRNLEKAWNAKVLDRTGLILEIFGARAQTAEGRLQVELAHLSYQKSRLVRSWTHLERQRGGAGFLGGPGERQIEADRRALQGKIDRLRHKLEQVRKTRTLQRSKRKRAPYPVISLVGYTNAGKSTLFNRLTNSAVLAQDMLFATLDPTMRAVNLQTGHKVILSDTVGFISDLPTELVAAFRATLEEVNEADIIVHVRDASHPDSDAQRQDVIEVLMSLGIEEDDDRPFVEVLNKIDVLDAEERASVEATVRLSALEAEGSFDHPLVLACAALTGEGVSGIVDTLTELITRDFGLWVITLPQEAGAARAWLHGHGDVLSETETGLHVRLSEEDIGKFRKRFPEFEVDIMSALHSQQASA